MTLPRMWQWALISLVLLAIDAALYAFGTPLAPAPHHVAVHKANLVSLGAWLGYWVDRGVFPYARPHEAGVMFVFCAAQLRRAVIVAASILTVGLGL